MDNQYYTPSIEEFTIGFECEWLCGFPDWPVHVFGEEEIKWRKIVISEKHDFRWIVSKLEGYPNLRAIKKI